MTTLTSPSGPSEVINARRTESLDAPSILKLVQPSTEALFGRVNIVNVIEKAVIAVTLTNEKEEVLGHAAFFDYPNVPGVDPAEWEEWLSSKYDCSKCNALTTLFMHYFVAKPEYSHGCAQEIIRTVFNAVADLHYCFLVVPVGVYPDSALAEIFNEMNRVEGAESPSDGIVFGCYRHEHVPVLHVRPARVEDHDDLVPIFNRQSDMLKKTYGDYFLAEMMEAQQDNMQCIVAEVSGAAMGFMSVCTDINVDLLNECFELGPFHGLRKPHTDDVLKPPHTPTPQSGQTTDPDVHHRPESSQSVHSEKSTDSKKSNTGSLPEKELKVKPRLSDADLESPPSLLDQSDQESIKSQANDRQSNANKQADDQSEIKVSKPENPQAAFGKRFVPSYKGASNAVCIQLFCIDERFEMRSLDLMPAVFGLFPDYDYCVVTVPHMVPEFPLLQQFVRVSPRCPSVLAQELYLFSRAGLLKNMRVRRACSTDTAGVEKLVEKLDLGSHLVADFHQYNKARRDDDGSELQAFVADVEGQVVGVAVTRIEQDIEYIRSHYNIEDFIYYNHHQRSEHCHLHHYALNPVFKHYSKHFLKEVLRLGHKTCIYYPLYPSYVEPQVLDNHSLVAALSDMIPVRARRQISIALDVPGGNAPSERVLQKKQPFALNHINRKLTLEPKVAINARIVVVGASDVGIAFLETFAFCPHLRFNNMTLISPHGLPGELPPDELRDRMLGSSHCYTPEQFSQMALRAWVNVVYGKMTAIDRKKKHVLVNGGMVVPYDHLIICCGTQYQVPALSAADTMSPRSGQQLPTNAFTINDAYDAALALQWIENHLLLTQGTAVMYGGSLDAYCCVQTLLALGVPGERICMVEPPAGSQPPCFENTDVEQSVQAAMKEAGVTVYAGYLLSTWNDGKQCDTITSAFFKSEKRPLSLDCDAFFTFHKRSVDYDAFKAVNDACLVYDGRLVIDAMFHTNDVAIRAAGPITKFQRIYHANQWTHANFNSKEVGIQLASSLLSLFDPTLDPEPEPPLELLKLIPMYRSPKIQAGFLPGGFHYLHMGKPNLGNLPGEKVAPQGQSKDVVLITGTPGGNPGYFRLHINEYNTVETVTCFSKQPFPASNLMCLFGLHEKYLNNLLSRHQQGLISDLYRYFEEPWSLAIFHDRFPDFCDEVRELLVTRPAANVEALEEQVRSLIDEDVSLNKGQNNALHQQFQDTGTKRAVETRLLSFLSYNYYHLPGYAKPGMV